MVSISAWACSSETPERNRAITSRSPLSRLDGSRNSGTQKSMASPMPDTPKLKSALSGGECTSAKAIPTTKDGVRSEEHTSELQSRSDIVCRLLLEKKKIRSGSHKTHI